MIVALLALLAGGCSSRATWSDEFEGPSGSAPDPRNWSYDLGGSGWGNAELESYTAGRDNAWVADGALHLVARPAPAGTFGCWYGTCRYTSARLTTRAKFSQTYGRVSARLRVPAGVGLWPAFWMLGADLDRVGFPACGEIDVVEALGDDPLHAYQSVHGPGFAGALGPQLVWTAPAPGGFHVYAVDWEPGALHFSVDDAPTGTLTPKSLPPGSAWVFDHPFFLVLNLAVGGTWPGSPAADTQFPAELTVDWVRVEGR